MKQAILASEICLCVSALIIALFWMKFPKNYYFPIILSVITILTTGFEIFRRNYNFKDIEKHTSLTISEGNTLFVNYTNKSYHEKPQVAILFYSMQITNVSESPFTLKEISLEYQIDNKTERDELSFIPVEYQKSPLYKEEIPHIKIYLNGPNLYTVL